MIAEKSRERENFSPKQVLNSLSATAIQFAKIKRAPIYSPDHSENNAEHTFMLCLVAPELAREFYPDLDEGLILQYTAVHDLVELETGDQVSLNLTMKQIQEKSVREKKSLELLSKKLPPLTMQRLIDYESQRHKEARFVKAVDKLLPSTTDLYMVMMDRSNIIQDRMERIFNIKTLNDLKKSHQRYLENFRERFGVEFPELAELLEEQTNDLVSKIKFLDDPQMMLSDYFDL